MTLLSLGELATLFNHYPEMLIAVVSLFGLIVGSFLNVVIARLPVMMERSWKEECAALEADASDDVSNGTSSHTGNNTENDARDRQSGPAERFDLIQPRSQCPQCGHRITAAENIPLISWLLLRGKCADCGTRISIQYPLVELISALGAGFLAAHYGFSAHLLGALIVWFWLLPLVGIDLKRQWLPDSLTLSLLWLGLLFSVWGVFVPANEAVLAAVFGYASLWLIANGYKLITQVEGMGYGDLKLLAALGAWTGPTMLPLIAMIAAVSGALIGIAVLIANSGGRRTPIPFGPFLAVGGLVALIWGDAIVDAYFAHYAGLRG